MRRIEMAQELGRLLSQGINGIANQQSKTISWVQDDLAFRCAQAVGRDTLSGDAVQKWRQKGHIPQDEYVEVMARACVKEGGMGRAWLKRFLKLAQYFDTQRLVAELFTDTSSQLKPVSKVYHDLPTPTYGNFVGRKAELNELRRLLQPYPKGVHHVITINGVGGVGKTTLALKLAHDYLSKRD